MAEELTAEEAGEEFTAYIVAMPRFDYFWLPDSLTIPPLVDNEVRWAAFHIAMRTKPEERQEMMRRACCPIQAFDYYGREIKKEEARGGGEA